MPEKSEPYKRCPVCFGNGQMKDGSLCSACHGDGHIPTRKSDAPGKSPGGS